jgi:hypothetical protein
MPKKPIDYSKTYIYKIVCKDPTITDIYVGHTTDPTSRKYKHKGSCNNPKHTHYTQYVYQFIRDNGGWDNWELIIIECISCIDVHDARATERKWLETLNATLNSCIPSRTEKEWYMDNKDRVIEKTKQYYAQNKEVINEKHKQYYEHNKEEINEKQNQYRQLNRDKCIETSKQYYTENHTKCLEQQKQYREKNKEIITEKRLKYFIDNKDHINQLRRERRALKKLQNTDI